MYICTATRDQLIVCTDCYVLLSIKILFEFNTEDDLKPKFNIKMYFMLQYINNFIIYISV